jgi:CBS domain containing-hemolysin-like protein
VVRLFGVPAASETEETHSEEEVRIIIEQAARQGILDPGEKDMLEAVFELEERRAREVMVPRPDVVVLPAGISLEELFSVTARGKHTRYPVHEDEVPDQVLGEVHIRDVMHAVDTEGLEAPITAGELAREILVVPENRLVGRILEDFQKQELQMAVVIDEWGTFEGLITIEDIIEEIVGEIRDEFDEEVEPAVRELPDGAYSIDGSVSIGVVNEALGSQFESEDFDTIGGLVFGHLGRVSEVGDEVRLEGYLFRVEEVEGPRIERVIVQRVHGRSRER